jgi:hypothetical protein
MVKSPLEHRNDHAWANLLASVAFIESGQIDYQDFLLPASGGPKIIGIVYQDKHCATTAITTESSSTTGSAVVDVDGGETG